MIDFKKIMCYDFFLRIEIDSPLNVGNRGLINHSKQIYSHHPSCFIFDCESVNFKPGAETESTSRRRVGKLSVLTNLLWSKSSYIYLKNRLYSSFLLCWEKIWS